MVIIVASCGLNFCIEPINKSEYAHEIFDRACTLFQENKLEEAIINFKKVQHSAPSITQAYYNCGMAYLLLKNPACAIKEFEAAIAHNPAYTKAYVQTGLVHIQQNNTELAIQFFEKAIEKEPACVRAHIELARILCDKEDLVKAEAHLLQVLKNGIPDDIETSFTMSNLFIIVGNAPESLKILEYLHSKQPDNASIMHNLSFVHKTVGNFDRAIDLLKTIIKLYPDRDESHFALGHTLLAMGNFKEGWAQHDRFLLKTDRYSKQLKDWINDGTLEGKHILLQQEGGLGDTIQWIRCAQHIKKLGATVTACISQSLVPLLSRLPFIDHIIVQGQTLAQIPHVDAHATIMSLPAILCLPESAMSDTVPYITADPTLIQYWGTKLAQNNYLKVGLCWQSDTTNDMRRQPFARRNISFEKLSLLCSIPNINFYNLQINNGSTPKPCKNIIIFDKDFDHSHGPFMDTTAVLHHMDLVITVDTAIAHLAGAMAIPVWLMLPYQTDWRWIANRTDSPWYPTMRIFKQPAPFYWDSVVLAVYKELQAMQNARNPIRK